MKNRNANPGLGAVILLSAAVLCGQTRVHLRTQSKAVDFSQSGPTRSVQTGTVLPSSCSAGESFFLTAMPPGLDLHLCNSSGVWTPVRSDLPLPVADGKLLTSTASGGATWLSVGGDVAGAIDTLQVQKLRGRTVSAAVPASGDLLKWDAEAQEWQPGPVTVNLTPGLGLLMVGTTIGLEDAIVPLYAKGGGAPAGNCLAGRDSYTDTNTGELWHCGNDNSWQKLAAASHEHSAAAVTSGLLGLSRGGTNGGTWNPGECVRVSSDGTKLESAGGPCAPASLSGTYQSLKALPCGVESTARLALPTDSQYEMMRCNGAGEWEHFLEGRRLTPPPTAWTWLNQGTATADMGGGALALDLPDDGGATILRAQVRAAAGGAPWRVRAVLQCSLIASGNACGVVLHESSSDKAILFGLERTGDAASAPVLRVLRYSTTQSPPTVAWSGAFASGPGGIWLQIHDDGTTRSYAASLDGRAWKNLHVENTADYLMVQNWGVGGSAASVIAGPMVTMVAWEIE